MTELHFPTEGMVAPVSPGGAEPRLRVGEPRHNFPKTRTLQ